MSKHTCAVSTASFRAAQLSSHLRPLRRGSGRMRFSSSSTRARTWTCRTSARAGACCSPLTEPLGLVTRRSQSWSGTSSTHQPICEGARHEIGGGSLWSHCGRIQGIGKWLTLVAARSPTTVLGNPSHEDSTRRGRSARGLRSSRRDSRSFSARVLFSSRAAPVAPADSFAGALYLILSIQLFFGVTPHRGRLAPFGFLLPTPFAEASPRRVFSSHPEVLRGG